MAWPPLPATDLPDGVEKINLDLLIAYRNNLGKGVLTMVVVKVFGGRRALSGELKLKRRGRLANAPLAHHCN